MIGFSPLSHNFIFLVAFTMMGRICKKLLKYTNVLREVYCPCVSTSKTVLDSRFQIPDFRYWILDSKAQDSRFHILKFSGTRNADYLTWFEVYFSGVITSLNYTLFFGGEGTEGKNYCHFLIFV